MSPSEDHKLSYSITLRDKSDRFMSRFLFFSTLLVFLHLLDIEPSEIDIVGVKFSVKDSSILYAAVSLITLHNFYQSLSYSFTGNALWNFSGEKAITRSLFRSFLKSTKGDWKTSRKYVWWVLLTYNLFQAPYLIIITGLVLSGLLFSFFDVYYFLDYLINNPPKFIVDILE